MTEAARKIDDEICHYLTLLTDKQKEAVLTVAKTFVEESGFDFYDIELKNELDSRYEDDKNSGELIDEKKAAERINAIVNGR